MKKMFLSTILSSALISTLFASNVEFDPKKLDDSKIEFLKKSKNKNSKIQAFNHSLALYAIVAKKDHPKAGRAKEKMCEKWNALSDKEKQKAIHQNFNMYLFDESDLEALNLSCM